MSFSGPDSAMSANYCDRTYTQVTIIHRLFYLLLGWIMDFINIKMG